MPSDLPYQGFHVAREYLATLWSLDITYLPYSVRYLMSLHLEAAYSPTPRSA